MDRIVIVGAGLAGVRTAQTLQALGFGGEVVLLGDEDAPPYDRPPLSKSFQTTGRHELLDSRDDLKGVSVHLGVRATGLDTSDRFVATDRGRWWYDRLVIATGVRAVPLPFGGPHLTLRTLHDAQTLRERFRRGRPVVIIGASWLGAELATAALQMGCHVTCIEAAGLPFHSSLGVAATMALPWWKEVDLRLSTTVTEVGPDGVVLSDGSTISAETVVSAIGVRADTRWLDGSGLECDDGVVVNDDFTTADDRVYAIGDVAVRRDEVSGTLRRFRHWDGAVSDALDLASALASGRRVSPGRSNPAYFWSDVFGHRVQMVGSPSNLCRLHTGPAHAGVVAAWSDLSGHLCAALVLDAPNQLRIVRGLVVRRAPESEWKTVLLDDRDASTAIARG